MPKIKLVKEQTNYTSFSIRELLQEIRHPTYQRAEVWTQEQQDSFIVSCLFGGHIIPAITVLCEDDGIQAENCFLLDGMQRYYALKHFIEDDREIWIDSQKIRFSQCTDRDRNAIYGHNIHANRIKGNDSVGITWIDNEQKRVSHTPGDYIFRHKGDRDIARMTHEIIQATKEHMISLLDRDACHGDYAYHREQDLYPIIALSLAILIANCDRRILPSCWPNRDGVLWLDRQEIASIKYDENIVAQFIARIKSINNKFSLQILIDIIAPKPQQIGRKEKPPAFTYCRAILKSGERSGQICGNKVKELNEYTKQWCCGVHRSKNIKFQPI